MSFSTSLPFSLSLSFSISFSLSVSFSLVIVFDIVVVVVFDIDIDFDIGIGYRFLGWFDATKRGNSDETLSIPDDIGDMWDTQYAAGAR